MYKQFFVVFTTKHFSCQASLPLVFSIKRGLSVSLVLTTLGKYCGGCAMIYHGMKNLLEGPAKETKPNFKWPQKLKGHGDIKQEVVCCAASLCHGLVHPL